MNVTISINDELLRRARALAHRQGTSLQQMVRDYLQTLVADRPGAVVAEELLELMTSNGGRSGGKRFAREAAYEGRL